MTVPIYALTDTWNNGAAVFNGIGIDVTDTASDDESTLLNLKIGGTSKFAVRKDGVATVPFRSLAQDVAAAGANQAAATQLSPGYSNVTSGTGGVKLGAILGGEEYVISNNIGGYTAITVYPASGEQLNGRTANSGITLMWGQTLIVKGVAAGKTVAVWSSQQNSADYLLYGVNGATIVSVDNSNGSNLKVEMGVVSLGYGLGGVSGTRIMFNQVSTGIGRIQQYYSGDADFRDIVRFIAVNAGVNYTTLEPGVAGSPPAFRAAGADTDVDLLLAGQGAGLVRFGTRSAIGAETVTGYITIKDASGTTRKLAVVS